jgi:hypothetical protein
MPREPSSADWRDLSELVPSGSFAAIMRTAAEPPAPWESVREFDVVQMVEEGAAGAADAEAISLGAADVPEMMELVAETNPGPFPHRTIELGSYLGIRHDGRLVAMAGERFQCGPWREISGVCTSGGRGRRLTAHVVIGRVHDP